MMVSMTGAEATTVGGNGCGMLAMRMSSQKRMPNMAPMTTSSEMMTVK